MNGEHTRFWRNNESGSRAQSCSALDLIVYTSIALQTSLIQCMNHNRKKCECFSRPHLIRQYTSSSFKRFGNLLRLCHRMNESLPMLSVHMADIEAVTRNFTYISRSNRHCRRHSERVSSPMYSSSRVIIN